MNLSKEIASMYDDAVRIRQDLHRIPEIGFQLHDTQAYVLNELRRCAPDRLETLAVCGVKAVFFAKDAQKTIALRADMDGIHNDEANDVPYRSQRPGCMHGCGHDGHMTILLLLARWIAKNRARLHCNVVLLFQPGEEGWAGARRMIDDGALEKAVDEALAANPDIVEKLKSGNMKPMGAIIGAVMRATRGQADAKAVTKIVMGKIK